MKAKSIGYILIVVVAISSVSFMLTLAPIKQSLIYHNFEDARVVLNIPNFWNVISNIPFLAIGVIGLLKMKVLRKNKEQYLIFFIGIVLISFGSGYYHLNPNNETLFWDRLPMTITFMALFSILISEFIHYKIGKTLLWPLLTFGLISIIYWIVKDDLRLYILIQFYPIVVMPVILICFKTICKISKGYWVLLVAYLIAKLFEHFDAQIYKEIHFGGHALKHILSSVGLFYFLKINAFKYAKQ